jgi:hypothetical protein
LCVHENSSLVGLGVRPWRVAHAVVRDPVRTTVLGAFRWWLVLSARVFLASGLENLTDSST